MTESFPADPSSEARLGAALDALSRLRLVVRAVTAAPGAPDTAELIVSQASAGVGASGAVLAALRDNGTLDVLASSYPPEVIDSFSPLYLTENVPLADTVRLSQPIWVSS